MCIREMWPDFYGETFVVKVIPIEFILDNPFDLLFAAFDENLVKIGWITSEIVGLILFFRLDKKA